MSAPKAPRRPRIHLPLRCSSLPRAFLCPGSVRTGEVEINASSDAARMGHAVHEGAKALPLAGRIDWDGVPALAQKHRLTDLVELRFLLGQAQSLWRKVQASFPNARTEVAMRHTWPDATLTGTADILARTMRFAYVGDWKGGRLDDDHAEQVKGYAALALLNDPSLEQATAGVLWIREQEWEHYTLTREELDEYVARLHSVVVHWDRVFRPGPHCKYCPRSHDCPARSAMLKRDVEAFAAKQLVATVEHDELISAMAPDDLINALERADLVFDHAKRVRDAIRDYVTRKGDIVGGQKRLTLQTIERRNVSAIAAFPILTDTFGFNDDEFEQVVDISVARAEKIVADRAGKGEGVKARRALNEALEAANAITVEPQHRLITRRK